jgi:hypothetical protein
MRANSMRLRRSAPSQKTFEPSARLTTIMEACAGVGGFAAATEGRSRGRQIAGDGPLGAEEDVGLGDLEVAGLHQLLLHHVLDLLDVDEGLLGGVHAGGDGRVMATAGAESRWRERKVLRTAISTFCSLQGTTWLLRRMTRRVDGGRRLAVDGDLAGAVEQEALGDEVGVVVDEGLLDQLVEGVERQPDRRLPAGELGEVGGDLAADFHDPGAVGRR